MEELFIRVNVTKDKEFFAKIEASGCIQKESEFNAKLGVGFLRRLC
jgi:hypothetical protein